MSHLIALLGPTNTGKTYTAMERMLSHESGVMGFPLRLLARENYEKACRLKGKDRVALITGEEKIIPPRAQFYMCTVESMPLDMDLAFVAVDEIQLAADPERGHVFTDRLLYMRGTQETFFMGAGTMAPLIRKLLPEAEIRTATRFSTLSYISPKKLKSVPRRSAVIVFSAAQVYETAEFLRAQRGGCAVVLGALSPRTRNAQVQMYQSGEVDYLVGTDAIGLGLNLDLEHVTFARLRKFDGRHPRALRPEEIGQIAGRAGRHTRDGTFSTTPAVGGIDETAVSMIENHTYAPVQRLNWRNPNLRFDSLHALKKSLEVLPQEDGLQRLRLADDQIALDALTKEGGVAALLHSPAAVRTLWDVCQIPDFRKALTDQHHALQQVIFGHLVRQGQLPTAMVEEAIESLNKDKGDIDTLVNRIAAIRTWTYVTHRGDWLPKAASWAERARAVDDKLSDALHKRLTQRFVDRTAAILVQKLRNGERLMCEIGEKGDVSVEGTHVGVLRGLAFTPDLGASNGDKASLLTAARRTLGPEITARLAQLEADNDGAFRLDEDGALRWREARVGQIIKGASLWAPEVSVDDNDFLDSGQRDRVAARLAPWLKAHLRNRLAPFLVLQDPRLSGAAKGLCFQLWEDGGLIARQNNDLTRDLTETDKALLAELKVQLTRRAVFVRSVYNAKIWGLRRLLWARFNDVQSAQDLPDLPDAQAQSLDGFTARPGVGAYLRQLGFLSIRRETGAPLYVRADRLDRLESKLYALYKSGQDGVFALPEGLGDPLGLDETTLPLVLAYCQYRPADAPVEAPVDAPVDAAVDAQGDAPEGAKRGPYYRRHFPRRKPASKQETRQDKAKASKATASGKQVKSAAKKGSKGGAKDAVNPDSPFAILAALKG